MAGKIFVNYRRDDERAMVARVRDRLAGVFGSSNVFMDVDNLMAGQRFDKELEKALTVTDVFLAVIGPRWLDLLKERQATGERDYVCEEISGALKRGVVVIPVLIEKALLPRGDSLPEDMRELVLHQKHSVTHEQFGRDVAALVEAIRFARQPKRSGGGLGLSDVPWSWVTLTAIVLVLGGWIGAHQLGLPVWWPFEKSVATLEPSQADLAEAARKSVLAEQAKVLAEQAKKNAAEAEAKRKADEEAQKEAAAEKERQRIAEEEKKAEAAEGEHKAGEDAQRKADAEKERQQLAELERKKSDDAAHKAGSSSENKSSVAEEELKRQSGGQAENLLNTLKPPTAAALKPGETFRDCADCPKMVVVPAGEFLMGSSVNEIATLTKKHGDYYKKEGPRRKVSWQFTRRHSRSGTRVRRILAANIIQATMLAAAANGQ